VSRARSRIRRSRTRGVSVVSKSSRRQVRFDDFAHHLAIATTIRASAKLGARGFSR
jgi:hypothetical protein